MVIASLDYFTVLVSATVHLISIQESHNKLSSQGEVLLKPVTLKEGAFYHCSQTVKMRKIKMLVNKSCVIMSDIMRIDSQTPQILRLAQVSTSEDTSILISGNCK